MAVEITGTIAPTGANNPPVATFAATDSQYNLGGYRAVADQNERLHTNAAGSLTKKRRRVGMMVYQVDTQKLYILTNNPTTDDTQTSDWTEFQGGGSSEYANRTGYPVATSGPTFLTGTFDEIVFVNRDSSGPDANQVFAIPDPNNAGRLNVIFPAPPPPSYTGYNPGFNNPLTIKAKIISDPNGAAPGNFSVDSTWIGTVKPIYNASTGSFTYNGSNGTTQGLSPTTTTTGGAKLRVQIVSNTTTLYDEETTTLNANGQYDLDANARTRLTITNYQSIVDPYGNPTQYVGEFELLININDIFADNSIAEKGQWRMTVTYTPDQAINDETDNPPPTSIVHNQSDVFADSDPLSPSLIGATYQPLAIANQQTLRFSGIDYLTAGTTADLKVDGLKGLNGNTQGGNTGSPGDNIAVSTPTDLNMNPFSGQAWITSYITNFNDDWDQQNTDFIFDKNDYAIGSGNYSKRSDSAGNTIMTLFDPWNNTDSGSSLDANLKTLVLTNNNTSSDNTVDDFNHEGERYILPNNNTTIIPWGYTSWQSQSTVLSSNRYATNAATSSGNNAVDAVLLINGSNSTTNPIPGKLYHPKNFRLTDNSLQTNLTGFTPSGNPDLGLTAWNKPAVYHRKFILPSGASAGGVIRIKAPGFNIGNLLAAATDLKMYFRKVGQNVVGSPYGPLNLHGSQFSNAFDDGATGIDTQGACIRTGNTYDAVSGISEISYSLGSKALTGGFWLEIQLIDTSIVMEEIIVTF